MNFPLRLRLQKVEAQGPLIIIFARDEQREKWVIQVPFRPFFYVKADEADLARKKEMEVESGYVGIDNKDLVRVYTDSPAQVPRRRHLFSESYEADIPYTRRFLIDSGIRSGFILHRAEVMGDRLLIAKPEDLEPADVKVDPRVWRYDIETNKPPGESRYSPPLEAKGAVTCLTLWDTFRGSMTTYVWHPHLGHKNHPRVESRVRFSRAYEREVDWDINWFGSEEEMLLAIVNGLKRDRPDVLFAWNGHKGFQRKNTGGFDAPYLITRLNRLGIGGNQLSPLNSASCGYTAKREGAESGLWYCRIDGVQLVDGMTVYQVKDGGFTGMVPFSGLKAVLEVKSEKRKSGPIVLKKDPTAIEDWWLYSTEEFLEYSFNDVDALNYLEEQERYVEWARELQDFVGAEETDIILRPGTMVSLLELRKAHEKGVCLPSSRGDDYKDEHVTGGYVIEPRQSGVRKNVIALDLNRMYVAIIQSANISYETFLKPEEAFERQTLNRAGAVPCAHGPGPEVPGYTGRMLTLDRGLGPAEVCPGCVNDLSEQRDAKGNLWRHPICAECGAIDCGYGWRSHATPDDPFFSIPSDQGFVCLKKDPRGLTPEVLDDLSHLRDKYDILIKAALTPDDKDEWRKKRTPVKSLLLTSYGNMLNRHNRLFWPDNGRAVTGCGRSIVRHLDRLCNRLGIAVDRGDTDSVFIVVPDDEDPVEFGKWLEQVMNDSFNQFALDLYGMRNHNFHVEFQTVWGPYVGGKEKKRYAGFVPWEEGVVAKKPTLRIKGLEGIKSDAAKVTEEATEHVLTAILHGQAADDIVGYVRAMYQAVAGGELPLRDIIRSVSLNFDPDKPSTVTSYVLDGAKYGKEMFGFQYPVGGRVRVVRLRDKVHKWLSVPELEDLPDAISSSVDWSYHAEGSIASPISTILGWVDLKDRLNSIRTGSAPTGQTKLY